MAKARKLEKRRKSIRGIRKITRTMELIATAQFKRAMDRAAAATAYTRRLTALAANVAQSGLTVSHPLVETREETNQAILLVLSANRGMCGGYNASLLRLAQARLAELDKTIPQMQLEVSGKRGISAFRFRKRPPDKEFTHFEDKPKFEEVDVLASRYLESFEAGRLDRLDVVYTRFESLSRQQAVVETLLPLSRPGESEEEGEEDKKAEVGGTQYEFLPSAESILEEILPRSFKVRLFKCFLDAAVSEQIARMVAMKTATENADSMISHLTMVYNRARQGQITSELLEVLSGAEALSK
jgi:F-type H+-transporting ATPase subunit gamma